MKTRWPLKIGRVLLLVILAVLVFGFIVMQLWNALIPDLFAGPVITFWQAIGLIILSHILLRGGPGKHGGRHHWRRKFEEKRRFAERWEQMTPEEREKLRTKWGRCGWEPEDGDAGE
jgi:hypothetical protein